MKDIEILADTALDQAEELAFIRETSDWAEDGATVQAEEESDLPF